MTTVVPEACVDEAAELSAVEEAAWLDIGSEEAPDGWTTTTVLAGWEDETMELDAESLDAEELGTITTVVPDAWDASDVGLAALLEAASLEAAVLGLRMTDVPCAESVDWANEAELLSADDELEMADEGTMTTAVP